MENIETDSYWAEELRKYQEGRKKYCRSCGCELCYELWFNQDELCMDCYEKIKQNEL